MRSLLIVVGLAAALATLPAFSAAPARCSRIPDLAFGPKDMRMGYVLGTGMTDTVLTGPGPVRYDTADGHFGRGANRPIHGQQFAVERIGSSTPLPAGVTSVIVVPWDYAADCSPTPWGRSYRWLPTDQRFLIYGSLRDAGQWVNGVPTLDVRLLVAQPYPNPGSTGTLPDSVLRPDQLFTLLDALPDADRFESAPNEAIAAFAGWTAVNPEIARRWPANRSMAQLRRHGELALLRKLVPPISGTFRFAVARPGRDSVVFFVRTAQRPYMPWPGNVTARRDSDAIKAPEAYILMAVTAASQEELPAGDDEHDFSQLGLVMTTHEPRIRPDGSREWDGRVEFRYIEGTMLTGIDMTDRDDHSVRLGVFTMDPAGRVRAEMTIGRAGGRPVIARGERISTTVINSPW